MRRQGVTILGMSTRRVAASKRRALSACTGLSWITPASQMGGPTTRGLLTWNRSCAVSGAAIAVGTRSRYACVRVVDQTVAIMLRSLLLSARARSLRGDRTMKVTGGCQVFFDPHQGCLVTPIEVLRGATRSQATSIRVGVKAKHTLGPHKATAYLTRMERKIGEES